MKKPIKVAIGDHSKEISRLQTLLMPQEMQQRNQKKLSEFEFQKRVLLRTQVERLLKAMEDKELKIEELTTMVLDMPSSIGRSYRQGKIQFPI